jgi:hypothetical protein
MTADQIKFVMAHESLYVDLRHYESQQGHDLIQIMF